MAAAPSIAALQADLLARQKSRTLELIARGTKDANGNWIPGPLWWAWNTTETYDNHWTEKKLSGPHRVFPKLPYLSWLFYKFLTERILFVPKSRELLASWSAAAYAVWLCQLFPSTRVLIQCQKLEKACELVRGTHPPGYGRTLYERQDPWLRAQFPLAVRMGDLPADRLAWKNGSVIQAIGRGADQVRLYHPTVAIFDEAAHLEEFEASFGAALPVAKQLICVSSAGPGFFGDVCSAD